MKPHRLAEYFPVLEGDEFEQLKQDIKDNGQLEPIVTVDGKILDGVNRWKACQELGIDPITKSFNGSNPLKYVISANIRRRHLTVSQRAMLALELMPEFEAEGKKRMEDGGFAHKKQPIPHDSHLFAAQEFGVSRPTVVRAKRVKEKAPERIPDILAGNTTISQVDNELRESAARERAKTSIHKEKVKKHEGYHQDVKDYTDALREFEKAFHDAVEASEFGKFSPEAARFVMNKHTKIVNWICGFDDILGGIANGMET